MSEYEEAPVEEDVAAEDYTAEEETYTEEVPAEDYTAEEEGLVEDTYDDTSVSTVTETFDVDGDGYEDEHHHDRRCDPDRRRRRWRRRGCGHRLRR